MSSCIFPWKDRFQYLGRRMFQRKKIDETDMKTELRRCFSTIQLTFLGIGSTIGVGIYVLLGEIAKEHAGPAVVICFILAILITLMNALVFSELSSDVPQTGAAYTFFYKIFGEYPAFLCGWFMLVCYIMSSSIGARAWSGMLDSFFNNSIQAYTTSVLGTVQFGLPFAEHLDIVAFLFQISVTIIVTCNVQCSSVITTTLGVLTTSVLVFVCITGLIFGDASNFVNSDHGGIFPFGLSGVVKGTSLALYATSGFDIISMSAEEAKDPGRAIPRAIGLELAFVAVVYIGAAVGMLFLIPYWLIDLRSPLSSAFDHQGLIWGKYIVTIGPLFGITNLQMLGLYGCSRVLYRMSNDNLFFSVFLRVNSKTGTPMNSIIFAGSTISVFALLFDLSYLVAITVLLMLITNLALGSALIKLKVLESKECIRMDTLNVSMLDKPTTKKEFHGPSRNMEDNQVNMQLLPVNPEIASGAIGSWKNLPGNLKADNSKNMICDTAELVAENDFTLLGNSNDLSNHLIPEGINELENGEEAICQMTMGETCTEEKQKHSIMSKVSTDSVPSIRARIWTFISPHIPEKLSVDVLIFLHWVCCITLSYQIVYGWHDILSLRPIAVVAVSFLLLSLGVTMFVLWLQRTKRVNSSFQTPLMPLVPTLAIVGSAVLLFSAISSSGMIELCVMALLGSFMYLVMIWADMQTHIAMSAKDDEQMKSLVDYEDTSEDEL